MFMNKSETIAQFLATQSPHPPLGDFILNFIITLLLSWLLSFVYIRFGRSLSNRRLFSRNFIFISATTMLIISIVKSSLALSLGLVGALSIVRFRTAIKEPEELSFLFLSITLGLGLGADQRLITIVGFLTILSTIIVHSLFNRKDNVDYMYLHLSSQKINDPQEIISILNKNTNQANLKQLSKEEKETSAIFTVDFKNFSQLNQCQKKLRSLDNKINIEFVSNLNLPS